MATEHRVGELAKASGLTVRTLHYYEEIGLLVPSCRTEAGHRRYDEDDVARLYRICLLRRLGLPLAEIGRALADPAWNPTSRDHSAPRPARPPAGSDHPAPHPAGRAAWVARLGR